VRARTLIQDGFAFQNVDSVVSFLCHGGATLIQNYAIVLIVQKDLILCYDCGLRIFEGLKRWKVLVPGAGHKSRMNKGFA